MLVSSKVANAIDLCPVTVIAMRQTAVSASAANRHIAERVTKGRNPNAFQKAARQIDGSGGCAFESVE